MTRISLLGVPLDALTREQAIEILLSFLREERQKHVMTPNSEMLVEAARHPLFRALLQSNLNLPDSVGLLWMARWTEQEIPERITGVDTVTALCSRLTADCPVFLLGAQEGVAERAAEVLRRKNPQLQIAGTYAGSPKEEDAPAIIEQINAASPLLLLVAYGAPQQDLWIAEHLKELPGVRVAMGVGGTFDFLAGVTPRAPLWMQRMGLEWLWRLFREPRRIGRIWNAVVVFPLLVLRHGREGKTL